MTGDNGPPNLDSLIRQEINGLTNSEALAHVGALIDAAFDARSRAGTDRAFALLDTLAERRAAGALLHYFRANAWENRRHERDDDDVWAWEQPEVQAQILELRRAVRHDRFAQLPAIRQCQIVTNLAGRLSSIRWFIEAIRYWDRVLEMDDGNRGIGLHSYANALYDSGHAGLMQVAAYDSLSRATEAGAFYDSVGLESARAQFEELKGRIGRYVEIDAIRQTVDLNNHSLGETAEERAWAKTETLKHTGGLSLDLLKAVLLQMGKNALMI
jgi:hypothetical protein